MPEIRYLSVCSGIEAASVAWEHLGWTPLAFSEVDRFASQVLAHRYPEVPNLGDMTKFMEWNIDRNAVNLLVGGTPCQSFSVAGLRKGLEDPRGNLALTFISMVDHYRPEWVIWENVPGVLSSSGGRDFGSFIGALGQLGYGFAYRVLDAQYFGVPQRRRRVFVVGHSSGDSRRAAEILFEPESLRGDNPKSRAEGKETTYSFAAGLGIGSAKVTGTLCALDGPNGVSDQYAHEAKLIVMADGQSNAAISTNEIAPTLNSSAENPIIAYNRVINETAYCVLASDGYRYNPNNETMIPVMYDNHPNDSRITGPVNVSPTVAARWGTGGPARDECYNLVKQSILYQSNQTDARLKEEPYTCQTVLARWGTGGGNTPLVQSITFQPGNLRRQGGANPSFTTTTTLKASSGDQTPHVAIPIQDCRPIDKGQNGLGIGDEGDPSYTLDKMATQGVAHTFKIRGVGHYTGTNGGVLKPGTGGCGYMGQNEKAYTVSTTQDQHLMQSMAVRRLTPVECERLQGFPDGWTNIKNETPDGSRYKAIGNSMAVPVMRWIGERINRARD